MISLQRIEEFKERIKSGERILLDSELEELSEAIAQIHIKCKADIKARKVTKKRTKKVMDPKKAEDLLAKLMTRSIKIEKEKKV